MLPFTYSRPDTLDAALAEAARPGAALLAGGTVMVDLMRAGLAAPSRLVDIGHLDGLASIEARENDIRLGALVRMADAAENPMLLRDYTALTEGLQLAASQQIRNAATLGGNLLQRTRCVWFRAGVPSCNKLHPGSGCSALDGDTREMALFGGSDRCIATYPGDFATVLAAFDASVEIAAAGSRRTLPFRALHLPYGESPERETVLEPGEIITAILVRRTEAGKHSAYVKVRDRQSYAYAVVSAAAVLEMDDGRVAAAGIALCGVATRPWASAAAAEALRGREIDEETALAAGRAAFEGAEPRGANAVKIPLGARAVARAVLVAARRGETVRS